MARKGKAAAQVQELEDEDVPESPEEAAIQEGRAWYVIHTYSGYENKVKTNLEHRIQTMDAKTLSSRSSSRPKTRSRSATASAAPSRARSSPATSSRR